MYVDLRVFSLTVPPMNHVGNPLPVIPFVILCPPQFFEACLILIFACKPSANATQALLPTFSYTHEASNSWTLRMIAMIPSSPSSGFFSCSRSCLSVWWWVRHSFSEIFLARWVGILFEDETRLEFLESGWFFLGVVNGICSKATTWEMHSHCHLGAAKKDWTRIRIFLHRDWPAPESAPRLPTFSGFGVWKV